MGRLHHTSGLNWPAVGVWMQGSWPGDILVLALLLAAGLWVRPYALSVYHVEIAGKLLEDCLIPVYPDRLAPEQIADTAGLQVAVEHLERAIRLDPRNVQAMRLLGRVYLSQGRPQAALQVLQRALAVRPKNPLLHLEVADVYDSLGYTEEALREYQAGGIGSRDAPLTANYLKLADAQMQMGSGEMAIHLFRQSLSVDLGNLYALYHLYRMHRELGDAEQATIYWQRLISIDPQAVTVPPDFRLAEYQGRAMVVLVEEGIWEREKLLIVVSNQVNQAQQSVGVLPRLMVTRLLEVLRERYPADPDLVALHQAISDNAQGDTDMGD